MSKAQRFIKKSVVVEAIQFNGYEDYMIIQDWVVEVLGVSVSSPVRYLEPDTHKFASDEGPILEERLAIKTLEGEMIANIGDWVICGVKNEFYPCKPDIFEETYSEDLR